MKKISTCMKEDPWDSYLFGSFNADGVSCPLSRYLGNEFLTDFWLDKQSLSWEDYDFLCRGLFPEENNENLCVIP